MPRIGNLPPRCDVCLEELQAGADGWVGADGRVLCEESATGAHVLREPDTRRAGILSRLAGVPDVDDPERSDA